MFWNAFWGSFCLDCTGTLKIVVLNMKASPFVHFGAEVEKDCTWALSYTEMTKPVWLMKLCDMPQRCHRSRHFGVYTCRFSICEFRIWLLKMSSDYKWQLKGNKNTEVRLGHLFLCYFLALLLFWDQFWEMLCWKLFCLTLVQNQGAIMSCLIAHLLSFSFKYTLFFFLFVCTQQSYMLLSWPSFLMLTRGFVLN